MERITRNGRARRWLVAAWILVLAVMISGCMSGSSPTGRPSASPRTAPAPPATIMAAPVPSAPDSPDPEVGPIYATHVRMGKEDTVVYDQIHWFTGVEAEAACRWKKQQPTGAWCTAYYWYNDNGKVWRIPMTKGATVEVSSDLAGAGGLATPARISAAHLRRILAAGQGMNRYWEFTLTRDRGKIQHVRQLYVP